MAKRVKQGRTVARLKHPVTVEIREAVITPLKSIKHLDLEKLARAARSEVELGYIEGSCCRQLVSAVVRKGMVTDLTIEPCPENPSQKAGPELVKLLKLAQRRARAAAGRGPQLPMPVPTFFSNLARLSVKGLMCFEICFWGWCIGCCLRTDDPNAEWHCGRLTVMIDLTSGPYPEPHPE